MVEMCRCEKDNDLVAPAQWLKHPDFLRVKQLLSIFVNVIPLALFSRLTRTREQKPYFHLYLPIVKNLQGRSAS